MNTETQSADPSTESVIDQLADNADRAFAHIDTLGKWTNHVVKRAAAEAVEYTLARVATEDAGRQMLEDSRANHRNLNRMLTLVGALLIGLIVTYTLGHPALLVQVGVSPATSKMLAPYSFVITVMLDTSLALYSLIRKY